MGATARTGWSCRPDVFYNGHGRVYFIKGMHVADMSDLIPSDEAVVAATRRLAAHDWAGVGADLAHHGCAVLKQALEPEECRNIAALYARPERFRSHIQMARFGFGKGEYRYLNYPLPALIGGLRAALYGRLAGVANTWNASMGVERRYPPAHDDFLRQCHERGQTRPTPLILQYDAGDFNCLHQDLYGEMVFPLQVAFLLSQPGRDFSGGEFVLTEQRPRMQSRVEVVPMAQGDAVVFPVHHRPVQGARGVYRVNMRHGVSRVRSGRRHALGIIFHDAT